MSKDTIWDHPDVAAATAKLQKALRKALAKRACERLGNLLITAVSKEKSIASYYEGCTCPACSIFTLQGISADVFKLTSEVVAVPEKLGGAASKIH